MKTLIIKENEVYSLKEPEDHFRFIARIVNWKVSTRLHAWRPPTDVVETENEILVRVEIAGMHEKEFFIQHDKDTLTISGNRSIKNASGAFHQMEIPYGEFSTSIEIPLPIDGNNISANYENGFLLVILPKAKAHRIKIQ